MSKFKIFVTEEIAKSLIDSGMGLDVAFPNRFKLSFEVESNKPKFQHNGNWYFIPTVDEVFNWILTEKHICCWLHPYHNPKWTGTWRYVTMLTSLDENGSITKHRTNYFKTPQESFFEAIKIVLEE